MMGPVALLLVEGGQVAQEGERVVDWLNGQLLGRGRLGRGREVGLLHAGLGWGGRKARGAFSKGLLIESWLASNSSTSGRDPNVQSPSLAISGNSVLFW